MTEPEAFSFGLILGVLITLGCQYIIPKIFYNQKVKGGIKKK